MRRLALIVAFAMTGCAHVPEQKSMIAAGGPTEADAYVELFGACPAVVTHFKDGTVNVQFWDGTHWREWTYESIETAPTSCKQIKL